MTIRRNLECGHTQRMSSTKWNRIDVQDRRKIECTRCKSRQNVVRSGFDK